MPSDPPERPGDSPASELDRKRLLRKIAGVVLWIALPQWGAVLILAVWGIDVRVFFTSTLLLVYAVGFAAILDGESPGKSGKKGQLSDPLPQRGGNYGVQQVVPGAPRPQVHTRPPDPPPPPRGPSGISNN
jgi:hypothetical protein